MSARISSILTVALPDFVDCSWVDFVEVTDRVPPGPPVHNCPACLTKVDQCLSICVDVPGGHIMGWAAPGRANVAALAGLATSSREGRATAIAASLFEAVRKVVPFSISGEGESAEPDPRGGPGLDAIDLMKI